MGSASLDDLVKAGKATFDGDRKSLDQLRGLMVPFAPNFEILPGTAPQKAKQDLKPFAVPELLPAEMGGD